MDPNPSIYNLLKNRKMKVPDYQRAYSWDTPKENGKKETHTDVFIQDLEDHLKSETDKPFYFGHFIFEKRSETHYIIDGQQRLTTIIIFLASAFNELEKRRNLDDQQKFLKEDIIARKGESGSVYQHFSTVEYDNQLFKDYVVERRKKDKNNIETQSGIRIVEAYDFFRKKLEEKNEEELCKMIDIITEASCTTHVIERESEAILMFIFQNNRGKDPTNLEIIKAQFMYHVHLYGGEQEKIINQEITDRFKRIYELITKVEYQIKEDNVLMFAARDYFNSLSLTIVDAKEKVLGELLHKSSKTVNFIKDFTLALERNFGYLETFFNKDERNNLKIHSLITLGGIGTAIPFILRAYRLDFSVEEIAELCKHLEIIVLRNRLIRTRADLDARLNDVFKDFGEKNKNPQIIFDRIKFLKETDDWWYSYWNNEELERALQGKVNPSIAKFLLWKYECYLLKRMEGYNFRIDNNIEEPELEHIAPKQEPSKKPHGYSDYNEEFEKFIECLGNYLLISRTHNRVAGNRTFWEKLETYEILEQQREIKNFVSPEGEWVKDSIQKRKEKIISFIIEEL